MTNFNPFADFGTQRPNLVADPNLPSSERATERFFNTSAFTIAPQFTIGNSSRNPVRGPQYRNADIALIKRTYFGENRNIEFRAEAFNVLILRRWERRMRWWEVRASALLPLRAIRECYSLD